MIIWIHGNSGSGKTTLAHKIKQDVLLDGDAMRLCWKLGFSEEDRWENNLRISKLARLLESQGLDVVVATICPYKKLREEVKKITNCKFIELTDRGEQNSVQYPYENN